MVQRSWEHQLEGGSVSHNLNLAVPFCKSQVVRHTSSIHSEYIRFGRFIFLELLLFGGWEKEQISSHMVGKQKLKTKIIDP